MRYSVDRRIKKPVDDGLKPVSRNAFYVQDAFSISFLVSLCNQKLAYMKLSVTHLVEDDFERGFMINWLYKPLLSAR